MARFVTLAIDGRATPPVGLGAYLRQTLGPDDSERIEAFEWLDKHCVSLGELDRTRIAELDRQLGLKLDGTPLAATTTNRTCIVCRACVRAAVEAGAIGGDPWPPRSKSRARRKVARTNTVDTRKLPGPAVMATAIDAISSAQPGNETYRVMTAVAYYAGLRPSETVMLRVGSLELPPQGWGRIDVTEADISFDEPGEPKTGRRSVPIPPVLVEVLTHWLTQIESSSAEALIFRTRNDTRPSGPNWRRAWHRALKSIGHAPLRVYDCWHAAATTWLRAGVPLGEAARRLGHSVETLASTYVGALDDEENVANERIEATLRLAAVQ